MISQMAESETDLLIIFPFFVSVSVKCTCSRVGQGDSAEDSAEIHGSEGNND